MRAFKAYLFTLFIFTNIFAQGNGETLPDGNSVIQGTVYSSENNALLEGVQISNLKTNENFYSAEDGSFIVPFDSSYIWLRFYYPGYEEKELRITGKSQIKVYLHMPQLKSSDSRMGGYLGNVSKYNNASTEYLWSNQVLSKSHTSLESLMQGQFAGVNTSMISGMPGEGGHLSLRGLTSLFANKSPLIVLDGMPFFNQVTESGSMDGVFYNPLKNIDAYDIQRIEVIKDGGSLYGLRGGSGVILVTTKHAETVTTKLDFTAHTGLTYEPEYMKLLSADGNKVYTRNHLQNSGLSYPELVNQNPWISGDPQNYAYNNSTNWQQEVFQPANVNKFNFSLQGGDEIAKFSVLLGYLNQQSVIENTRYQRYNFRLNSDISVIEKLYLKSNIGFTYNVSDLKSFGTNNAVNPINAALLKSPMFNPFVRDNQGNELAILSDADLYGGSNPTAIIRNLQASSFESNMFTNIQLLYEPIQDIKISTTVNVAFDNNKENVFVPAYGIANLTGGEFKNSAKEGIYKMFSFSNETRLDYAKSFNYKHFVNGIAGLRINTIEQTYNQGAVFNTPTDEFKSLSSVSLVQNTLINGMNQKTNYSDIFLKGGYRFQDKYLADVILTLSSSSNIGAGADALNMLNGRWGFFPSIHGAWLISNEPFLSGSKFLDLLKLRGSYSVSGNDAYMDASKYLYSSRTYGKNSGIVRYFVPNKSLKWEEIHQLNAGLDIAVFSDKLRFSLDAYSRQTNNLLTYYALPPASGFDVYWENNGTLKTEGIDLSLEARPLNRKLKVFVGGNLGLNRNTVELENQLLLDTPGGKVIIQNGQSAFAFYGLSTNGIYQTMSDARTGGLTNSNGYAYQGGDVIFNDLNPDDVIDENDRTSIGNLLPTINAGAYLTIKYGNFEGFLLMDYRGGNKVFNYTRMQLESFSDLTNQGIAALYSWKNDNSDTDIPRLAYNDPAGNSLFSDRWIEDGSFFRLKEVTLSYTLPKTAVYNAMQLFVTARNLVTFSNYLGYYPEFSYSANPLMQSADYAQIPISPQIMLGVNISF